MRLISVAHTALYRLTLHVCLVLGWRRLAADCTAERLRQAPGDAHALATRAHLLAAGGDSVAARVLLLQLLAAHPNDCAAWFNLGYLLEQQGDACGAEAGFRRATELSPRMDQAWYGLGLSLLAQQRWEAAEAALRRTTELQPWSPFGWVQLARVLTQRGDHDGVRHIMEHLRGFEPRAAAALAQEAGLADEASALQCQV